MELQVIKNKIYEIRGQKVMLDFDLAVLYEVQTKVLNQAVKRNKERFPDDFMFRLSRDEYHFQRSQTVTFENDGKGKFSKFNPYAFTEHGVTMLASVLKSPVAIKMNIFIVRAFIALRQFSVDYRDLAVQISELRQITGNHSKELNDIYEVLENLLNEKEKADDWKKRPLIGFKPSSD